MNLDIVDIRTSNRRDGGETPPHTRDPPARAHIPFKLTGR